MKLNFTTKSTIQYQILFGGLMLIITISAGFFGFYRIQKQSSTRTEESVLKEIGQIKTYLKISERQTSYDILKAQRIVDEYFQQNNLILENKSDIISIDAPALNSDETVTLNIPTWTIQGETIYKNQKLIARQTRISGAEISIWQKIPEGYVRICSNESQTDLPVLLYNSSMIIQTIEKGDKFSEMTNTTSEIFSSVYTPIYISGTIKGMIKIKINTQIPTLLNEFYQNYSNSEFIPFYLDKDGHPLIKSGLMFDFSKSQLFIQMTLLNQPINKLSGEIIQNDVVEHGTIWFSRIKSTEGIAGIYYADRQIFDKNFSLIVNITTAIIVVFLFSVILFILFSNLIGSSSRKIRKSIKTLAEGKIPKKINSVNSQNLETAEDLNMIIERTENIYKIADQLIRGDYHSELNESNDLLITSMKTLRRKLSEIENEIKTQNLEVAQRQKISEWNAKITEILQYSTNVEKLSHDVIRTLVEFLETEQGAVYFINDNNPEDIFLEFTAGYAYNKKRQYRERISAKDGLTARCIKEKQEIYLTEIPENYIKIASGFGETNPKYLVLIPLIFNNEVYGVVELASLKEILTYKIDFVKKIGENISSTFSGIRNNEKTASLLEQTRLQSILTEERDLQIEKELKELYQFKENARKKSAISESIFTAMNYTLPAAEMDLKAVFLSVNSKFTETIDLDSQYITGKSYHEIFSSGLSSDAVFALFDEIISGKSKTINDKIRTKDEREIWLELNFSPIKDENGKVTHILVLANNISEIYRNRDEINNIKSEIKTREYSLKIIENHNERNRKYLDREKSGIKSLMHGINNSFIRVDYSAEAVILDVNKRYEDLTGFTRRELIGTNARTELSGNDLIRFNQNWENILRGETIEEIVQIMSKKRRKIFLMKSDIPILDVNGKVEKVLFIAYDVSPFFSG